MMGLLLCMAGLHARETIRWSKGRTAWCRQVCRRDGCRWSFTHIVSDTR